ncbi:hypothetical protein Pfo_020790 [Paulownia fortunei]|nr:hypothetical protein Pfo_020790 [Paulownia fortunei]
MPSFSYPLITEFLRSGLYKWAGDAHKFKKDKPYTELVTSPNNPDGLSREAVVNQNQGILIHDLAIKRFDLYQADDVVTIVEILGPFLCDLVWALIKDQEIAKKMTEFIVLSTIGVSKESQLRAAKVLQVMIESHKHRGNFKEGEAFFQYSYNLMSRRWKQLRDAVNKSKLFKLPDFPPGKCNFSGHTCTSKPAFAWMKCEGEVEDCESFLHDHKILTRSGKHFGESAKYVRVSVLAGDEVFDQFTERFSVGSS